MRSDTNQTAIKLTQEGIGKMYCLAGIGAHIEGMVESARGAKRIVALDGCKTTCAKNTIEHAGLNVTDLTCTTDEGIEKNHQFDISPKEVELVVHRTKQLLSKPVRARK
ncbi:putative zinc-binding protein [Chloroflexota bacterium]